MSSTTSNAQPPGPIIQTIAISPTHDTTLKIAEHDKRAPRDNQGNRPIKKITYIKIERAKTADEVGGLAGLLRTRHFREAGQSEIELEEDRGDAMALLLRIAHGKVTKECLEVPQIEIFYLIAAAKKYLYQVQDAKPRMFFLAWWNALKTPDEEQLEKHYRQLMFLTYTFNHAQGFLTCTKWLAYNTAGHINPLNPTEHRDLGLPPRITGALNGARGSLRTILFDGTFAPKEALHNPDRICICRYQVGHDYEGELFKIGVYPLERTSKSKSINRLLDLLVDFDYEPHKEACTKCRSIDACDQVEETGLKTRKAFDGLCLDCMGHATRFKDSDAFFASFNHDSSDEDWGPRCRVKHGGKSRYFSFVATKDTVEGHRKGKHNGALRFVDLAI